MALIEGLVDVHVKSNGICLLLVAVLTGRAPADGYISPVRLFEATPFQTESRGTLARVYESQVVLVTSMGCLYDNVGFCCTRC
jgi:hypothetical protein